jgi:dTDP-4-dehydrorhamnose 3,5-epimerase
MIFEQTKIDGAFKIRPEPKCDERGFFARCWCRDEFERHAIDTELAQCNISFNFRRGTLRGMHFQAPPHAEAKLVRCTRGAIYDVVLDLRPESATFKDWISVVLTADTRNMVYVPVGCAHGFITLEDNTEVFYQMSGFYHQESARGVRWNDPAFQIAWPGAVEVISDRDANYKDFEKIDGTAKDS